MSSGGKRVKYVDEYLVGERMTYSSDHPVNVPENAVPSFDSKDATNMIEQLSSFANMVNKDNKDSDPILSFLSLSSPSKPEVKTCRNHKKRGVNHRVNKKKLADYMNTWLIGNWTNPYPDDALLQQLAIGCECDVNTVNTWLINARTRKWRPAIAKAYQLNRPSNYLKTDSINIFLGKPVEPIVGMGLLVQQEDE